MGMCCASPDRLFLISTLRPREVEEPVHGHTASTWQRWDSESNVLTPVSVLFTLGPLWVSSKISYNQTGRNVENTRYEVYLKLCLLLFSHLCSMPGVP